MRGRGSRVRWSGCRHRAPSPRSRTQVLVAPSISGRRRVRQPRLTMSSPRAGGWALVSVREIGVAGPRAGGRLAIALSSWARDETLPRAGRRPIGAPASALHVAARVRAVVAARRPDRRPHGLRDPRSASARVRARSDQQGVYS